MSVFHSNSVNAPAIAFNRINLATAAFQEHFGKQSPPGLPEEELYMAKKTVRALGTSSYGAWHFSKKSGRYQRTRRRAMKIWPAEFFTGRDAVMPARL
jgi:hypothetical protein